jgi:NitT/TauT family transport system substrate-binding protein
MAKIGPQDGDESANGISRRTLLRSATAAGVAAPFGIFGSSVLAGSEDLISSAICSPTEHQVATADPKAAPKSLKLTWNAGAICTVGVPVASQRGIFAKHNLDVELINFGGATDQLLEAIATGKADAGVGMALRWLKPLEQGFDVRITTAIHGGCMRLLAPKTAGISRIEDLRGKTVAVTDMAAPDKNFFSIALAKKGIDPNKEVEWRQYPADLLGLAIQKGEVQALAAGDPNAWIIRERDNLVEVATNLSGEYEHRACCVLGIRGSLIRDDRPAAAALTQALLEAQEWTAANPDEVAAIFAKYSPAKREDLAAMLRSHTHHHHPVGPDLKREIALYAEELKLVTVIKSSTNTAKFADRVYADVLS